MEAKLDPKIPPRLSRGGGRNTAHAYERLHLQHPGLSHTELLHKMLSDLYDFIFPLSPNTAERLKSFQGAIRQQAYSLGEFTFDLALSESGILADNLGQEAALRLRHLIYGEIITTLGYMPDSSETASVKRKMRDCDLGTEVGYSRYLATTYGIGMPVALPEFPLFPLENAVLQSRQEWQDAATQVARLGLPAHFQPEKNWDGLAALDCILRRTGKSAVVLDAGAELYSVFLPSLFLYGYRNLVGINVVFEQPLNLGGIRYQHGDITNTPFGPETFDAITCLSVVEHGLGLDAYFREAARILKVGGLLITSTDYYPTPIDTKSAVAYGVPVHIFTEQEITDALGVARDFGFELTCPLKLGCKGPAVRWDDFGLNYSFVIFTLQKKAASQELHRSSSGTP